MTPSPPEDKSRLRKRLRAVRAAVPSEVRRQAARALVRLALRRRLLGRGKRIAFYIPAKGEIDLLPLLNRALEMQTDCYLPVVPGRGKRKLWFVRLGAHPSWTLNRYGIPEYLHVTSRRVRAPALDRLFMPLLGFDGAGFRVGMGGGYYDASLAFLARRRTWRRPALTGVAYSVQEVDLAPRDPWDIPLNSVLTEQELRRFCA
ncbi:MAG: 5-formyltetrahydrofolate cyclo-ligase [Betaproteobacteria bacterium]|nr:5-formyltetrahydrofolate cyclo-ligase [Betaproteobacteria bacterium]